MFPFQPRPPAFGGRLKKQHQEKYKQTDASQTNADKDILRNGGPVENAIHKDLIELQNHTLPFPSTSHNNETNLNCSNLCTKGKFYGHYKQKYKELNFNTIYYDYPMKTDINEYIQLLYSATLGLLNDKLSSILPVLQAETLNIIPQNESSNINSNTLLQEAAFYVFTLYTLHNCNPLSSTYNNKDVLKMLPLHLKSQTFEGHANPKSTLHRRFFKCNIRIGYKDYCNLIEFYNVCLLFNESSQEGNEVCKRCLGKDVMEVLDRMISSPEEYFEFCEYSGPCSVEGYAGSRFVYKHTPQTYCNVTFTSDSLNQLGRDNSIFSIESFSSINSVYNTYKSDLKKLECNTTSIPQKQDKLFLKQKSNQSKQIQILNQILHPLKDSNHGCNLDAILKISDCYTTNGCIATLEELVEEKKEENDRIWGIGSTARALKAKFGDVLLPMQDCEENGKKQKEEVHDKQKIKVMLPTTRSFLSTMIENELQDLQYEDCLDHTTHKDLSSVAHSNTNSFLNDDDNASIDDYEEDMDDDNSMASKSIAATVCGILPSIRPKKQTRKQMKRNTYDSSEDESSSSESYISQHHPCEKSMASSIGKGQSSLALLLSSMRNSHENHSQSSLKDDVESTKYSIPRNDVASTCSTLDQGNAALNLLLTEINTDAKKPVSQKRNFKNDDDEKSLFTTASSIQVGQVAMDRLLNSIIQDSTRKKNIQKKRTSFAARNDISSINDEVSSCCGKTIESSIAPGQAALDRLLNGCFFQDSVNTGENSKKRKSSALNGDSRLVNSIASSKKGIDTSKAIKSNVADDKSIKTAISSSTDVGKVALNALLENIECSNKEKPYTASLKNDSNFNDDEVSTCSKTIVSSIAPGKEALNRLLDQSFFHDTIKNNTKKQKSSTFNDGTTQNATKSNDKNDHDEDKSIKTAISSSTDVGKAALSALLGTIDSSASSRRKPSSTKKKPTKIGNESNVNHNKDGIIADDDTSMFSNANSSIAHGNNALLSLLQKANEKKM